MMIIERYKMKMKYFLNMKTIKQFIANKILKVLKNKIIIFKKAFKEIRINKKQAINN